MPPPVRRLALTLHVATSVGWLGAVGAFLALAVATLTADDLALVRAADLAMRTIGWHVLVPLSLASLATGVIQSLGTPWGLFRHYWVIFKLGLNLIATTVLLMYTETLDHLAALAANPGTTAQSLRDPSPLIHAVGALLVLSAATVLAVFKPKGVTPRGRRAARSQREASRAVRGRPGAPAHGPAVSRG